MTDLTITDTVAFPGGYGFRRSDGRPFFMRLNKDGSASVFSGLPDGPPQEGISDLAVNVVDKVAKAKSLIVTYRG
jgi:hypothetical protein